MNNFIGLLAIKIGKALIFPSLKNRSRREGFEISLGAE